MSDIRVSVQWKSSAVFAGENIECKITFRNIAPIRRRSPSPNSPLRGPGFPRERWKDTLPSHFTQRTPGNFQGPLSPNAASLAGTGIQPGETRSDASPISPENASSGQTSGLNSGKPGVKKETNRRSLSIVSIGNNIIEETPQHQIAPRRPSNGHSRATSMQILPRRNAYPSPGPTSAPGFDRAFTVPSPLQPPANNPISGSNAYAMARSRSQTSSVAALSMPASTKKSLSRTSSSKTSHVQRNEASILRDTSKASDQARKAQTRAISAWPTETAEGPDTSASVSKILSPSSLNGTPRSSGEFYSLSNNSTETLASEYVVPDPRRNFLFPGHSRQNSAARPMKKPTPEVLMMGFGQILGSCVLDGSLINQAPFEEVKKKAIIEGRGGGGVVRSESTKRDSGLLKSFGWGNFGDSIGGFLGGNEMSSIKEAKKSHSGRSIPILSTPQSVLFVDLRLEPGESRSFTFVHPLPKGLPPSHKGKAMKIVYNLVIGTQKANQAVQNNHIHRVEVPFKVLPSVNAIGEILGHDLMSPHTFLTNKASTSAVDDSLTKQRALSNGNGSRSSGDKPTSSASEFSAYVDKLLAEGAENPDQGLLSPTEEIKESPSFIEELAVMKDLIDTAILRSNISSASKQSPNRFEIKRGGDRVAVIMLARPAFRLGETVSAAIDFRESDVSCYSLYCSLESWESVDPTIALRSKASIHRATRKVYSSKHETTISAERIFYSPIVPPTAVPEFITSGVSLEWGLRFEFVTSRMKAKDDRRLPEKGKVNESEDNNKDNNDDDDDKEELLEEILKDERGLTKAAVQGLLCETFDVTVPLKIYGAVAAVDENCEAGDFRI